MILKKCGDFRRLSAEEGFMVTNGTCYGKVAYLSEGEEIDAWYETEEVTDEY